MVRRQLHANTNGKLEMKYLKKLIEKIKLEIRYRRKLKELRKRDPFIYK